MNTDRLETIARILQVKFGRTQIWEQALVHRSYLNESKNSGSVSNERLEFLGDAVLEFIVSEWLYNDFPEYPEGVLTNLRSALVKTDTLAKIAQEMQIGPCLLLSRGEVDSGGHKNPALLANFLEAIIGALFLDLGIESAQNLIRLRFKPYLTRLLQEGELKDYKSLLQERLQSQKKVAPTYQTLKQTGPDHQRTFLIGVFSQGILLSQAYGKSKQEAEEQAAKLALEKIGN